MSIDRQGKNSGETGTNKSTQRPQENRGSSGSGSGSYRDEVQDKVKKILDK